MYTKIFDKDYITEQVKAGNMNEYMRYDIIEHLLLCNDSDCIDLLWRITNKVITVSKRDKRTDDMKAVRALWMELSQEDIAD